MSPKIPRLDERRASARRCFSVAELERHRASERIPEAVALRLVAHLDEPCQQCWLALETLPRLALADHEVPQGDPSPSPSLDPVVRALRTLGGWPPHRWLRPRHRQALDMARQPLGFLTLVIEEAGYLARVEGVENGAELLRCWIQPIEERVEQSQSWELAAWLLVRALIHLGEAQRARGDRGSAEMSLDQAERTVPRRPGLGEVEALLLGARARLTEPSRPEVACALFELAVQRVTEPRHLGRAALCVETLLDLAAFHLRHDELHPAERALLGAERALGERDEPLLAHRIGALRASLVLRRAERWVDDRSASSPSSSPGESPAIDRAPLAALERLTCWVAAFGHAHRLERVPAFLDAQAARDRHDLDDRLAEVLAELTPLGLSQQLAERSGQSASRNGHPRPELGLRLLLAAAHAVRGSHEIGEGEVARVLRQVDGWDDGERRALAQSLAAVRSLLDESLARFGDTHRLATLVRRCVAILDQVLRELGGETADSPAERREDVA